MKFWTIPALALLLAAAPAAATTLTSSLSAFQAGAGAVTVTRLTGLYDPTALILPVVSSVPLSGGGSLAVNQSVQIVQTPAGGGGFPYTLTDGFNGDLLIPVDASGNQLTSETINTAGLSGLGIEVAPFSSSLGGPYTITITGSNGQTLSTAAPGGSFATGATAPVFLGFFGGGVSTITISTTDPNGFAFGNIRTPAPVPEPASLALLAAGTLALYTARRRYL